MRRHSYRVWGLYCGIGFSCAGAAAGVRAQTVSGVVLDGTTGRSVPASVIYLLALDSQAVRAVTADDSGHFQITSAKPGAYRLRVERIGYVTTITGPVRLEVEQVTHVTLRLGIEAVPLDALSIESPIGLPALARVGYYDRKRLGHGRYIESAEIERRRPNRTSDLLRGLPGVRLLPKRGGMDVQLRAGGLLSITKGPADESCLPPIYLDGTIVSHSAEGGGRSNQGALNRYDVDSLPWNDIEAIEIYAGPAQVPPQYSAQNGACGVILFWTKR